MRRQIFAVSMVVLFSGLNILAHAAGNNLIPNPSVETASSNATIPQSWLSGKWGTNTTTFSYPVTGYDGSKAIKIAITAYTTGDAKWFTNEIPVTPGTSYTFTHAYQSNVTTSLDIRYTLTSGAQSYVSLAGAVPASSAWKTDSYTFTVPPNVASMTVMHIIESVGTLTTDAYSLTTVDTGTPTPTPTPTPDPTPTPTPEPAPTTGNLVLNPSFETQTTSGGQTNPTNWTRSGWGTNTRTFTYPVTGQSGGRAVRVDITSYTDGDVKWSSDSINNVGGKRYRYTQVYRSNVPTYVDVRYTYANGTVEYDDIGVQVEGSGTWKTYQADFEVPAGVISVKMMAILNKVGWLEVDSTSLVERPGVVMSKGTITLAFDDGFKSTYQRAIPILNTRGIRSTQYVISDYLTGGLYITTQDMLAMQSQGHEIGGHTRTHAHLTQISYAQAVDEIANSKTNLQSLGASISTFTYPYGEYNDSVQQIVRNAGYIGARSVNLGFNNKDSDKFALFDQHVERDTSIATIKSWIDMAIANNTWLILEFHQQMANCGAEQYCNTDATMTAIADYIVSSKIRVVTMKEGLQEMK